MELHFEELLGKITDFMKSEANTDTVVGKQFGFGSGGGEGTEAKAKKGQGMGAGAGVGIEPIGFLVTKGDEISFLQAGKTHGLAAAFEKVPDLIEKIVNNRAKEEAMV